MNDVVILNGARFNLLAVLGDRAPLYFSYLKQWFRMQSSKDEFDKKARWLLNHEQLHYHNNFLMALMSRVEGLANLPVSLAHQRAFSYGKFGREASTSAEPDDTRRFDAEDLIDYLPPRSPLGAGSEPVMYCTQEIFLPDRAYVLGRFMLAAWDKELVSVDDEAVNIMVEAIRTFLKNLLTSVVAKRKLYKTKGPFMYDFGAKIPNMWLQNSADNLSGGQSTLFEPSSSRVPRQPSTSHEIEHAAAVKMAGNVSQHEVLRVTLEDVYTTLLENRNIIGNHSAYAVIMEKILMMMSHPRT